MLLLRKLAEPLQNQDTALYAVLSIVSDSIKYQNLFPPYGVCVSLVTLSCFLTHICLFFLSHVYNL